MTFPFFSICIAAYNAQEYIDECLQSIAVQDCRDYEVVIVDDGSTLPLELCDKTIDTLAACELKRVSNSGPYAARQRAFDISRGEVILCVDADDKLLDTSVLSKLKSAFLGSGADIVLFNASASESKQTRLFDLSALGPGGIVDEAAVWRVYTKGYSLNSLWCKAFKRTLYTKGEEPRPRLLMAEDRLQSLEVMRNARSYWLIDEPLYFYRPNPASTTNGGYDPAYFHQACYVEDEVVACMAERKMPLDDWARYFLGYSSSALLGIKYNRQLDAVERRAAYADMSGDRVLSVAMSICPMSFLSVVDALRLSLLKGGHFTLLDLSMLPWRVGSGAKRLGGALRCSVGID